MSVSVKVDSTLTQCENTTVVWSASTDVEQKLLQAFVQGTDYFAETIASTGNLSGTLGSVVWTVDFPAGAWIAVEIRDPSNSSVWNTQGFYEVQPGTTDACLRQNSGQLAPSRMASLAASLSSASPQLFTGYITTSTRLSSTTSASITSPPSSLPTTTTNSPSTSLGSTSPNTPPSDSSSSSSGPNIGAIVGGSVGGVALLALAALLFFFIRRRNKGSQGESSEKGTSKHVPSPRPPTSPRSGDPTQSRINSWRERIRRPSILYAATQTSPEQEVNPYLSQGPRQGVPEIADGGDHYSSAAPTGSQRGSSGNAYSPLPAPESFENPMGSYASRTSGMVAEVMDEGAVGNSWSAATPRPPTRLTTPGGGSSWAGDEMTTGSKTPAPPFGGYSSYTRS